MNKLDDRGVKLMRIKPGPFPKDHQTGEPMCLPPTEIDIIKVNKVFNECMHTQVETIESGDITVSDPYDITVTCKKAEIVENSFSCEVLPGNRVKVTYRVEVTSKLNDTQCETFESEEIIKIFTLDRVNEEGMEVHCDIVPKCLNCFISDTDSEENTIKVTCCVGIMILLKVFSEVQLLIPTYGYPQKPDKCVQIVNECPDDFEPEWPPYPKQKKGKPKYRCDSCD